MDRQTHHHLRSTVGRARALTRTGAFPRARDQGATLIAVTDTLASRTLLVPTSSPHFFESYVATTALIETIIARLVSRGGSRALRHIAELDRLRYDLGECWEEPD